jgi:hypothetical protein
MYGIVNKAIQGLITENFGEEVWQNVKEESGVNHDIVFSNESYPDEETFKLAEAASKVLKKDINDIFIAFGEYWVLKTGPQSYGSLMQAGGSTFKEFMVNLPNFHNRVILIYPKLQMPEFLMTDVTDNSLVCHYYSSRQGLKYFVLGLLQGLGKMFNTELKIKIINSREEGHDHDVYEVVW